MAVPEQTFKPSKKIYCNLCPFSTEHFSLYENHIFASPDDHKVSCPLCNLEFVSIGLLNFHVLTNHELNEFKAAKSGTIFYCEFCGQQFNKLVAMCDHKSVAHKSYFECLMCPKKCFDLHTLFNHFQKEHALVNNVDLVCEECDSQHYFCPDAFKTHRQLLHGRQDVLFKCFMCLSELNDVEEFKLHVHTHRKYHRGVEAKFPDGAFPMQNGRPIGNVRFKQCYVCGELSHYIKKHMKHHFEVKRCLTCHDFVLRDQLDQHQEDHKNVLRPYMLLEQEEKGLEPQQFCYTCLSFVRLYRFAEHEGQHRSIGLTVHEHPPIEYEKYSDLTDVLQGCGIVSCNTCKRNVPTDLTYLHLDVHRIESPHMAEQQRMLLVLKKAKIAPPAVPQPVNEPKKGETVGCPKNPENKYWKYLQANKLKQKGQKNDGSYWVTFKRGER